VAVFEYFFEAAAWDEFHDEVVAASFLKVENEGGDARVFEVVEQLDLFIKTLNGGLAFVLGGVGVEQEFFDGSKLARPIDLFYFVDGTHATDAKHGDYFKFSIQDCSNWKRFKRHTICPYSLGTRYVASLRRWRQWRALAGPHLDDNGGDIVFAPMIICHVD